MTAITNHDQDLREVGKPRLAIYSTKIKGTGAENHFFVNYCRFSSEGNPEARPDQTGQDA
jgi:hypothetical protein